MKKKTVTAFFIAASIILAIIPSESFALETGDIIDITSVLEGSVDGIELDVWERFTQDNEIFSEITGNKQALAQYIKELIKGNAVISFDGLISTMFSRFMAYIKKHIGLAAALFGIALMSTLIDKLSKSLFKGSIASAASTVMLCSAVGLIISGFASVYSAGIDCVSSMAEFTGKALPVLMTLVTATGASASSCILQPGLFVASELTARLIELVIMPLLTVAAVLYAAYSICMRKTYSDMAGSVKRLADWIIGIMFTLFFGIISIQRLTAGALDGACIKTIKYTVSSFSLYGGSFLSKSFDVVTGCAVIMKNVLGGIGMIILLSICVCPALELLAVSVVYRISALLISLTGEERISACLGYTGKIYGTVFLCVMTAAILFFMLLSAIVSVGGSFFGI